jgi:hypothetical protein
VADDDADAARLAIRRLKHELVINLRTAKALGLTEVTKLVDQPASAEKLIIAAEHAAGRETNC